MTASFPNPGDLFEERYRVGALIGTGGFARVYMARDQDLGREVALKILTPTEGGYDAKLVDRFVQEARLVSRLRDPHTITMFDHGNSGSGLLYMVFEYIDGLSLSKLVYTEGALAPIRVMKILRQTLSSLEEAHSMGVMHRDIKPGNIMVYEHVGRKDQAKLLDFGIAKLTSATSTLKGDLTAAGALIGTPRYMSPEQIRGEEITAQSDIYSLGLVAYEMMVGKKAIISNSSITIIGQQLDPRPFFVPPSPMYPEKLRRIVNCMMSKDQQVRYQTATEVLRELELWDQEPEMPLDQSDEFTTTVLGADVKLGFPDISDEVIPIRARVGTGSHESASFPIAPVRNTQERELVGAMAPSTYPPGSLPLGQAPNRYPSQTLPPASMSSSALHQQFGADPSVIIVADESKKTMLVMGSAIIFLLVLIGVFALINVFKAPEPQPEPAIVEMVPEVVPEPLEPKVVAPSRRLMIRTLPTALAVVINGRPMGNTPVVVDENAVKFPMNIRVLSGKKDKLVKLKEYQADLLIDAADLVPPAVVPEPEPEPEVELVAVKKKPSKKPKKKIEKPKPDSEEEFSIPALDL